LTWREAPGCLLIPVWLVLYAIEYVLCWLRNLAGIGIAWAFNLEGADWHLTPTQDDLDYFDADMRTLYPWSHENSAPEKKPPADPPPET
jgi:hypothetical protein